MFLNALVIGNIRISVNSEKVYFTMKFQLKLLPYIASDFQSLKNISWLSFYFNHRIQNFPLSFNLGI